jgi:hypothetical protein
LIPRALLLIVEILFGADGFGGSEIIAKTDAGQFDIPFLTL